MDQVPATFRCHRRDLTLTDRGCVRLYVAANQPKPPPPWMGLSTCRACPQGSYLLTGKVADPTAVLTERLRMICPRCLRPAQRLIWGLLCVSCDARHREALKRCNAKGNPPALSDVLHVERIAVSYGGAEARSVTRQAVTALAELIVHASKASAGPSSYGRPGLAA